MEFFSQKLSVLVIDILFINISFYNWLYDWYINGIIAK